MGNGERAMIEAEACRSMKDVRAQIDALDGELVALLARRASYVDRAAELKPGEGLPARIGPRIDEVIGNVRRRAAGEGLDPDLIERIWRELIEWSIDREERAMAGTEGKG
jgi:isochorismate pyruvate lyase